MDLAIAIFPYVFQCAAFPNIGGMAYLIMCFQNDGILRWGAPHHCRAVRSRGRRCGEELVRGDRTPSLRVRTPLAPYIGDIDCQGEATVD